MENAAELSVETMDSWANKEAHRQTEREREIEREREKGRQGQGRATSNGRMARLLHLQCNWIHNRKSNTAQCRLQSQSQENESSLGKVDS